MAYTTNQTNNTIQRDMAKIRSQAAMVNPDSTYQRVVRGMRGVLWSATWILMAAQTVHGQSKEPPLEPIPMPAPLAKATSPQVPTPAPRVAPANYQDSAGQAISSPTEVIVESPPTGNPAVPADTAVMQGPVFRLDADTGERVIVQQPPQDVPPIQPRSEFMVPTPSPDGITYANPPAPGITEQATTARAYYVTPSIQVYLPRSTVTYRRAYYATGGEYPVEVPGPRVTVLRRPVINVTLGGAPVMPAGFFAPGPVPPPSEFGVVVAPDVIQVGPPPLVPGQPVRNAIRSMMW